MSTHPPERGLQSASDAPPRAEVRAPGITLAIIAGNVERYIERFIRSFSPLVDEIVIVRAIGSQEPDETLRIAQSVVDSINREPRTENREPIKFLTADYTNAPDNQDWPHLDDFAAARNKAFAMASNEWVLWADTDDTIDPASIQEVRNAFAKYHDTMDAFLWNYHVPEDWLKVEKCRIVRRSVSHWQHAIHEELVLTPEHPRVVRVSRAVILHAPTGARTRNDERNLRMLQHMRARGQMTLGHRFHLVTTLDAMGRTDEAAAEAASLITEPDLAQPERFELFMILARLSKDDRATGQLYLQALAIAPDRREAYGELAIWCCRNQKWKEMLAWARAMLAHDKPSEYLWNHRSQYYGWAAARIEGIALRVNGHRVQADTIQFNHFKKHGAKISLLHATRGRAKQALLAQHTWMRKAADPDAIEHIFAIDADDEEGLPLAANLCVVVEPGGGCVRAWNAAAAISHGALLVQMSDDWEPPLHWDHLILDRIPDLSAPAVLAISDGHRKDDLLCMAILTRARYQQQGFMFHPDFEAAAMFSDNYFTDRAYRDDVVIEARDIVFEHRHPAFDPSVQLDPTYAAQNAPEKYAKGKEIFDQLIMKAGKQE